MQRYFVEKIIDNEVVISKDQEHHIVKVMRMRVGEQITCVNEGKVYLCEISSTLPLIIKVKEELLENNELDVKVTLLYCLPKGDKLDLVIQKATEIGVKNIVLVHSSRCVCKFKKEDFDKKITRFKKIATEASEQSHRLVIPEIKDIIDYKEINKYHFDYSYIAY